MLSTGFGFLETDKPQATLEEKNLLSKGSAPYCPQIVRRVTSDKNPCVLVLPTGWGKSTCVPYSFIKAGYRVFISLPTIALCENIRSSFAVLFPSVVVGKAYERETSNLDAKIIACTNGYLKNRLLSSIKNGDCYSITFTDILILDEVHMNKLDVYIIVSLWYYCAQKFSTSARIPRLLLSSATVADTLLSRRIEPCVMIAKEYFKTPFPINTVYSDADYPLTGTARYKSMGALLKNINDTKPVDERVLIFIPGKKEMQTVMISSHLKDGIDVDFVIISSETSIDEYRPLNRLKDNRRLVVLSTPSGDAGLTIDGLVYVIDSGLLKNSQVKSNGTVEIVTEYSSEQLCNQRKGRVGRTKPGTYFIMCTPEFYNSDKMPKVYVPEIERIPLYKTIIEIVSHGLDVNDIFGIYNLKNIDINVKELISWGLLRKSEMSGELFPSSGGVFMSKLDIDSPRLASVLYSWIRLGYQSVQGIIAVHVIGTITTSILRFPLFEIKPGDPKNKADELRAEHLKRYYLRFLGYTEVHTALNIWNAMMQETVPDNSTLVEAWCNAQSFNYKPLKGLVKSVSKAVKIIRSNATELGIVDQTVWNPYVTVDETLVLPVMRRLIEHVYVDQIAMKGTGPEGGYVTRDGEMLKLDKTSCFTTRSIPNAKLDLPKRIAVISKSNRPFGVYADQIIDIDNPEIIANISTQTINEKTGVFVNTRGVGRISTRSS